MWSSILLLTVAVAMMMMGRVDAFRGQLTGFLRQHQHRQRSKSLPRSCPLKAVELCVGAERWKQSIHNDQSLKGLIVLPKAAFTPEEHDRILLDVLDGCSFEVLPRSQMEAVIEGTRLFGMAFFLFDHNIVINLRTEPEHGRNDVDLLPKFYKHIIKHRDILDNLEKQQRLGSRQDLDHAIVYYFGKSHSSDRMIIFPLRHPENEYSAEIDGNLMSQTG